MRSDAGKLRQIVLNLVGNAVKFPEDGTVRVRASWNNDCALIAVEDTGVGLTP